MNGAYTICLSKFYVEIKKIDQIFVVNKFLLLKNHFANIFKFLACRDSLIPVRFFKIKYSIKFEISPNDNDLPCWRKLDKNQACLAAWKWRQHQGQIISNAIRKICPMKKCIFLNKRIRNQGKNDFRNHTFAFQAAT